MDVTNPADNTNANPTPAPAPSPDAAPAPPNLAAEVGQPAMPALGPNATPPAAAPAVAPTVVHPVRRSGLGGIVDEIRDAISGTQTSKVYQDANGDKYVKKETLTGGQRWARVASTAFRGAAAGFAAGKGGNPGAALKAGIDTQDETNKERKNLPKQQEQEVQQQQLDKFNMIKLKHDIAGSEFALTRMKIKATDEDVKFAQEQQDREKTLGSADLGVYKDPADLANVQKQDPKFWQNVYANDIVTVPEIAPDGTRMGIHVYLRKQGIGNDLVPQGTQVTDFVPGQKPGDAPKLVSRTLNKPATRNEVDAYNNAAQKKYQDYVKEQSALEDQKQQAEQRKSEVIKNKAEANKFNAEAEKARSEAQPHGAGKENDPVFQDNVEGLASGRYLMGKDIPTRTRKEQTEAAAYNRGANEYSMKHFGLPYSPEIIRQESKMANSEKTQAFLTGVDRMIGTPGMPGQLDQVLDLAKKAGVTDKTAPLNTTYQWIARRLGNTAAKNFEQALSDTQTALGTLIGNPLIGGGESDLKLKTAQGQFGKDVTLGDLQGAAATTKEILSRARGELARNNRYIQQRYGEQMSPQNTPPPAPAGMVNVQIEGQPVGHIPQAQLEQFKKDHPTARVF